MRMMINFGGTFWNAFRSLNSSQAFEELISREDVTIQEVLDDDDVIQELKNHNSKLIEQQVIRSLTSTNISQLLVFLTEMPDDETDTKRCYKFPFVACELFACEVPSVMDKFFTDKTLLDQLFSGLRGSDTNSILAGYFSRVANSLINRNYKAMLEFIIENNVDQVLIDRLQFQGVSDVLSKILLGGGLESIDFKDKLLEIFSGILNKVGSNVPFEVNHHAKLVLVDVLERGMDSSIGKMLIGYLFQKEVFDNIIQHLLDDSPSSHVFGDLIKVILSSQHINEFLHIKFDPDAVVKQESNDEQPNNDSEESHSGEEEEQKEASPQKSPLDSPVRLNSPTQLEDESMPMMDTDELPYLLQCLQDLLPRLSEVLERSPEWKFQTTFGEICTPLGAYRLLLIEIVSLSLKLDNKDLQLVICHSNLLEKIIELFFTYEQNSMLHQIFEQIVTNILQGDCIELKEKLLHELKLPDKIINAISNPTIASSNGVLMRKGYSGYLTKIANLLNKLSETQQDVSQCLGQTSESWETFTKDILSPINTTESTRLGGVQPSHPEVSISDEDEIENNWIPSDRFSSHNRPSEDLDEPEDESDDKPFAIEELEDELNNKFGKTFSASKNTTTSKIINRSLGVFSKLQDMDSDLKEYITKRDEPKVGEETPTEFYSNQYWSIDVKYEDLEDL